MPGDPGTPGASVDGTVGPPGSPGSKGEPGLPGEKVKHFMQMMLLRFYYQLKTKKGGRNTATIMYT